MSKTINISVYDLESMEKEIEELKKENKNLKEENDRLKDNAMEDMRVQTKLEEKIRFLEECLDNKEKVNKQLREELEKRRFSLDEYDYIILTSTTPQIEIIKK